MATDNIYFSPSLSFGLRRTLDAAAGFDRLFIFCDSNTRRLVLPLVENIIKMFRPEIISMPAGEENKNLGTLANLWRNMSEHKATRRSLLLNIGGGVVTDLGGFAAATFKRGIRFINVPTTLLGAADAAVGGKTGIDFLGLKNEIGAFAMPSATVISPEPLATLPDNEKLSGFAEIVKMAMIANTELYRRLLKESDPTGKPETGLEFAVCEKQRIVDLDPNEKGIRKLLNFGHTAGHAFESLLLRRNRPVSHGHAVAWGILAALILSHLQLGTDSEIIHNYRTGILSHYPALQLHCDDLDEIISLLSHDKKTVGGEIATILLHEIGAPGIVPLPPEAFRTALEILLSSEF